MGNRNSGRKSTRIEHAKNEAIRKAWLKVNDNVESKSVKEIALPIALRDMTEKTDITSGGKVLPLLGGQSNGQNNNSDKQTTETQEED